jgi:type III secretion system low calcium response chaperone LcrH/SycD
MKTKQIKLALSPEDNNMSTLNDELSQLLAANSHPDQAISFSPDSLEAAYSIAYDFYRNGKFEDAKAFFRLLTIANSFERKYWMGLAACCHMLKLYPEAIDCYSAAALQDPSDPYAHWHAAECFFHLEDLNKAQEALSSALKAAQDNDSHHPLIPQLSLLAETWSILPSGAPHG